MYERRVTYESNNHQSRSVRDSIFSRTFLYENNAANTVIKKKTR